MPSAFAQTEVSRPSLMVFMVRIFCNFFFGVRRITSRKTARVDRLVYLPVPGALIVVWITIAAFTLTERSIVIVSEPP
jgi:hypothetical protein